MKQFIVILFMMLSTTAWAQRRAFFGLGAAWHYHSLEQHSHENVVANTRGINLAASLDYRLTERLSAHAQLSVHSTQERSLDGRLAHRAIMPELQLGLTEYIPLGNGAIFFTNTFYLGSLHGRLSGGQNRGLHDTAGFGRIRAGFGLYMGYQFAQGTYLRTGLNASLLSRYYSQPARGSSYFDWSVQILQVGHYLKYKQRRKRFFSPRKTEERSE